MSYAKTQLRLALRNARRNMRRTLLTAVTVLIGVSLTTVVLAFLGGYMNDILDAWAESYGHVQITTQAFYDRQQLQPLYENIAEVDPLLEELRALPGVAQAEPRIRMGVVLAAGEEIGEDFGMLVASSEAWFTQRLKGPDNIVAGTWLTGGPDEVVLGRKLANDLGVEVGDEILVLGQTQYGSMSPLSPVVVGVVSKDAMIDNQLYVDMETARWLVDMPDGALEVVVYGEDFQPEILNPVIERIEAMEGMGEYAVVGWHQEGIWAQALPMISGIQFFISGLMVFVMVLAIFNTMTMSVLERTAEIGVMRAMGQTRAGAVSLFLVEAAIIGLLGGVGGVIVGGLGGWYLEVNGVSFDQQLIDEMGSQYPMTNTFYADVYPELLLQCLLIGLFTAALGALLPAIRAASIPPSHAMRARR